MAFFFFTGALASVTRTFVNPYSGYSYSINGEYSMNDSTYFGTANEVDLLLMSDDSDILLLEDEFGNRVLNHIDQIIGSNGNDIINLASTLYTLGDIGLVTGDDGNDLIWTNIGNDYISGGTGNDTIDGGGGNDILIGGSGADYLSGGAGVDTADYSLSDINVTATLAVTIDLVVGTGSGGDAQGDILVGIENVTGTNQATQRDTIYGNNSNNIILGMAGDDILEGGGGADTINGGDGWDYARYTRSASGVNVNLKTNVNTGGDAQGDLIDNVEAVVGSEYNDVIVGGDGKDYLKGENGDDTLNGGLGTDQLFGGQGNDTYIYAAGRDTMHETGYGADRIIFDSAWQPQNAVITNNLITFVAGVHEVIFNNITLVESFSFTGYADMTLGQLVAFSQGATDVGTAGNDTLIGTAAMQRFDGLAGNDTVDYTNSTSAVTVDLLAGSGSGGYAVGDTYVSIENVTGSNGASLRDYLYGNNDNNTLYGLAGDDFLEGGGGADIIDGGAGWDYARYSRSDTGIYINLETGVNMGGHAIGDVLLNIEAVVASNHNDMLRGGNGNDQLQGGNGNDIMTGGLGRDLLYGGAGADIFVFEADKTYDRIDMIRDFSVTQGDVLNITDLLDGFDLMNDDIADFVQLVANGGNTDVRINADGDIGGAFVTAFTVEHGITQSLTDLLSNGNLVVDQIVVI